jgi:CheY-like chemotaxis protein
MGALTSPGLVATWGRASRIQAKNVGRVLPCLFARRDARLDAMPRAHVPGPRGVAPRRREVDHTQPDDRIDRRRVERKPSKRRAGERRRARRRLEAPVHGVGVLVVEDDEDSRDILRDLLEANGYPVMTAKNGKDALDRLKSFAAPCLILLDLRMPVMDGWTFRERMLADPLLATIPVVAVSAAHPTERARRPLPFTSYIEKPFEFDLLLRTVRRFC